MSNPKYKIFRGNEMSSSDFKAEQDHVSAADLITILNECPAKWRNQVKEFDLAQKTAAFGASARTMMASPEKFYSMFERQPLQNDFEGQKLITSVSGLQGWLKERGLPGRSKSDPFELIDIIRHHVEIDPNETMPVFWHEVEREARVCAALNNRELVPGDVFDSVQRMRQVLLANERFAKVIGGGESDISLFGTMKDVKIKVRLNRITDDMEIWNYRTARSTNPVAFCRSAYDLGYPMTMAMEYHAFRAAYDRAPNGVSILAQEKEEPFIPLEFRMSYKTRKIGEYLLTQALALYNAAKEADKWPVYNNGEAVDLDPPAYKEREFAHLFEEVKK